MKISIYQRAQHILKSTTDIKWICALKGKPIFLYNRYKMDLRIERKALFLYNYVLKVYMV